jgi:hypothetical protein
MRRIGEEFYGQSAVYAAALAETNPRPLRDALARNVFGARDPAGAAGLALYVRHAQARLAAQDPDAIAGGSVSFPDPATIPHSEIKQE